MIVESGLVRELREHEAAWHARPLLRALYRDWFELIRARLVEGPGHTVELGSGIGTFADVHPGVLTTDVERTPWSREVVDAEALPWEDGQLANLVLIDVFHHLADPARFLDEAARTLRIGGRVVVLDPYCSPVSGPLYRRFHRERTDLRAAPFDRDDSTADDPLASNQARATLAFFRAAGEYRRRWPQLPIVEQQRMAMLAYPLSGGFEGRPMVPARIGLALRQLERALSPVAPLLAFRCLVVLERRDATGPAAAR